MSPNLGAEKRTPDGGLRERLRILLLSALLTGTAGTRQAGAVGHGEQDSPAKRVRVWGRCVYLGWTERCGRSRRLPCGL